MHDPRVAAFSFILWVIAGFLIASWPREDDQ